MSTEYRSSDSDRVIIPYEQQEKDNEKFTIMPNQSIVWNSTGAIHKSLRGIHDGVSIIARSVFCLKFYLYRQPAYFQNLGINKQIR